MHEEYISEEEVEQFEREYQEYLRNRTPEQKAEDDASTARVVARLKARLRERAIYERLLREIFGR